MLNYIPFRKFHLSFCNLKKIQPKNLKGKSKSSQEWLTRQLNDEYVIKAKKFNYRCRSAFKLIEIDDKFKILKPGMKVIDCGAAPGSWTQVIIPRINSNGLNPQEPIGKVISIDLQNIYPLEGSIILGHCDFTHPTTQDKVKKELGNHQVDLVVSDMAPNSTGVTSLDDECIVDLGYQVLRFAVEISKPEIGALLVKVWDGGLSMQLEKDMARFYNSIKIVRPPATRSNSREKFLLARKFKGLKAS